MTDRRRVEPDAEVLPAKVAERLLQRASELDAVRNSGTAVAELRAAATEAGISVDAFDAALGELKTADQTPAPVAAVGNKPWRRLFFGLAGVGAFVLVAATIVIPMRVVPAPIPTTVEQAFPLKCLPADMAIDLIRPILTEPWNTVVRRANSNTLVIRGTDEQLKRVHAVIDQADNAQSCARK